MCACKACEGFSAPLVFHDDALRGGALYRCECAFGDSSFFLSMLVTTRVFRHFGMRLRQYVCGENEVIKYNLKLIEEQLEAYLGGGVRNVLFDGRVLDVIVRSRDQNIHLGSLEETLVGMRRVMDGMARVPEDFIGGLEGVVETVKAYAAAHRAGSVTLPVPRHWAPPRPVVVKQVVEESALGEHMAGIVQRSRMRFKAASTDEEVLRRDLEAAFGAGMGGQVKVVRRPDGSFVADMTGGGPMDEDEAYQLFTNAMAKVAKEEFGCHATVITEDMRDAAPAPAVAVASSPGGVRTGRAGPVAAAGAASASVAVGGRRRRGGEAAAADGAADDELSMNALRAVLEEMEAEESAKAAKVTAKQAAKAAKATAKQAAKAAKATTAKQAAAPAAAAGVEAVAVAAVATVATVAMSEEDMAAALAATCMVCMENHRSMAFACGHVSVCESCYDGGALKGCPMCTHGVLGAGEVGRRADLVWPDSETAPPRCSCGGCAAVFPQLFCTDCKRVTCAPCGKRCRCKTAKGCLKLYWS